MMFERIYETGDGWRLEVQAGHTVYSLTLDEAWKLALEIIWALKAHYKELINDATGLQPRR